MGDRGPVLRSGTGPGPPIPSCEAEDPSLARTPKRESGATVRCRSGPPAPVGRDSQPCSHEDAALGPANAINASVAGQSLVAGTVPPEVLLDFDDLRISPEPLVTVIHGSLPDQAALHALLARLETYHAQLS